MAESGGEWHRAGRKIFEKSQKVSFLRDSFDISVNSFDTPCRFLGTLGLETKNQNSYSFTFAVPHTGVKVSLVYRLLRVSTVLIPLFYRLSLAQMMTPRILEFQWRQPQ